MVVKAVETPGAGLGLTAQAEQRHPASDPREAGTEQGE